MKSSTNIRLGTNAPVKGISCKDNGVSSVDTDPFGDGLSGNELPLTDFERSMNQLHSSEDTTNLSSIIGQLENNYKSEREKIYQSGYQAGVEAGQQELERQYGHRLQSMDSIVNALKEDQWRLRKEAELSVLNLALQIAERVIQTEIQLDRSKIENVVEEALDYVQREELVKIILNPADYQYIDENSNLLNKLPADVKIESDNSLMQGGCVLQTNLETVDASVERKLKELATQLYTKLPESEDDV